MDGILIIDKPAGITSHDVVARCRRILKTKKIGHTGTLDPFATGVMVILVGKATRLAQFLNHDRKEYEAVVRFGFETDTGDLTGEPRESSLSIASVELSDADIDYALARFRGEIMQTPPMYSAKKIDGKKLYELARKGIEVERKPCQVNIYELELMPRDSTLKTRDFSLRVLCSAGTYIRVLAEDIGRALGAGAHLAALRRVGAGDFRIDRAVTLQSLEAHVAANTALDLLVPMNESVAHLVEIVASEAEREKIGHGGRIFRTGVTLGDGELARISDDGELLAIARFSIEDDSFRPIVVLM